MHDLFSRWRRRATRGLGCAAGLWAVAAAGPAAAQPLPEGYLCCNMRSDGAWISDSNYAESGKYTVPMGTPVKVTGYGRHRVLVEIDGKPQAIGNDYSRDIALPDFARRYVVRDNPAERMAGYPERIQRAIATSRVTRGMDREQVLMALGYPISSETPHLDARVWHYWLWTFSPFKLHFDQRGLLSHVDTDADTRRRVVMD